MKWLRKKENASLREKSSDGIFFLFIPQLEWLKWPCYTAYHLLPNTQRQTCEPRSLKWSAFTQRVFISPKCWNEIEIQSVKIIRIQRGMKYIKLWLCSRSLSQQMTPYQLVWTQRTVFMVTCKIPYWFWPRTHKEYGKTGIHNKRRNE